MFTVYGEVAAGLPQIEEQPVALEMYICSPNNCVINLAYDVSAHPAHEPENSSNGECVTVCPKAGEAIKMVPQESQSAEQPVFDYLVANVGKKEIKPALVETPIGSQYNQPHPIQSKGDTDIVYFIVVSTACLESASLMFAGAAVTSSAERINGLIVACEQTNAQLLH